MLPLLGFLSNTSAEAQDWTVVIIYSTISTQKNKQKELGCLTFSAVTKDEIVEEINGGQSISNMMR